MTPTEAIEYFENTLDLDEDEIEDLEDEADEKAFRIAGVASVDVLVQVHQAIVKSLEEGTPYEDFAEEIGPVLETAWQGTVDNPGARIENIFRTNVQKAYNAGRWKAHQEVANEFPYAILDVVEDARTSDVCAHLDAQLKGKSLPASDPFWGTHTPPLHFNCRSQIIYLSEEQAEEIGISKHIPKTPSAKGFGNAPDEDDWAPDASEYPEEFQDTVAELSRIVTLWNPDQPRAADGKFGSGPGAAKAPKGESSKAEAKTAKDAAKIAKAAAREEARAKRVQAREAREAAKAERAKVGWTYEKTRSGR